MRGVSGRLFRELGRIRVRILGVMLVVVVVPIAGLELARVVERQLLGSLERDMRNQAILVARVLEVEDGPSVREWGPTLVRAGRTTRMRVRILGPSGAVTADSHPSDAATVASGAGSVAYSRYGWSTSPFAGRTYEGRGWPPVSDRPEVRDALSGSPSASTRIRPGATEVLLFVSEPVRGAEGVAGAVYVTRSTEPVLVELYRIRAGLVDVLVGSLVFAALLTLVLAWSISRPLTKLATAAREIADEPLGVAPREVPIVGSGEIRDLALALRSMTDRLADRAAAIREFAADVAHEFKSPLTSIRGAAELLLDGADDDSSARERFIRNIREDSERLDRLVTRLLELSRLESSTAEMSIVDLAELSEEVAQRQPQVAVHMEASSRFVRGRRADLDVALRNVVDNALRFSPEGEAVDLMIRHVDAHLEISITDNGDGIDPKHLSKIFDRFFTTDAQHHGTGLGLPIVRTVVRAHGGDVHAISPSLGDRGTTIVMRFPTL